MKGFLLFILSIVSIIFVAPFAVAYGILKGRLDFMSYAISIDQTINLFAGPLFSDLWLIDSSKFPFGDMDKTISYNIGRNAHFNNLNKFGKLVNKMLDSLDEGHSKRAFQDKI